MGAIGLALVKFSSGSKKYLFQTPKFETLKRGDLVFVEGSEDMAIITDFIEYCDWDGTDEDWFTTMVHILGAQLPLKKVTAKLNKVELTYRED